MQDNSGGGQIIKELADHAGYLWMIVLAVWGGTVSYIARINATRSGFRLLDLLTQWLTSGFVGLLAGYLSLAVSDSTLLAFVLAGMSGHMGAAALVMIERIVKKHL